MSDRIELEGLGSGARAAKRAADEAKNLGSYLDAVKAKGGAALKVLNDFAGPLALASGWALAFVTSMAKGLRQTELVQRGLERIAKMQLFTPEFAKLLGGLALAKARLEEIGRFSTKSPFSFDDVAQGNKRLEILTHGLLSTKEGMKEVGDLAAAGGTSFSEMASIVGSLHDALANGRPIAQEVQQLRALGVISTDAANRLDLLATSGVSFGEKWSAVQTELRKSAGSMKTLSDSLAGLQARLDNARAEQQKSVGEQFAEGEKAGLEASIKATEAMTPVLRNVATVLGSVWTAMQKMIGATVEFISKLPVIKGGLTGIILAFTTFVALLAAFSVATTVAGIVWLASSLGALATRAGLAVGAMTLLGRTLTFIGFIIPRLLGPWGLLITAISALTLGLSEGLIEAHAFGKAQEALKKSIEETNQAIQEQIKSIQTQADKAAAISKANRGVIDAQDRLQQAHKEGRGVEDRERELAEAKKILDSALKAPTNAAVESNLGPDFAVAKRESQARQQQFEAERQKLQQQREAVDALEAAQQGRAVGGGARFRSLPQIERARKAVKAAGADGLTSATIAEKQRDLAARQAADADSFSREQLGRIAERRELISTARVETLQRLFKRTGDTSFREEGDRIQDEQNRARFEREAREKGIADPGQFADAMTARDRIFREQDRVGRVPVSSLAAIGGAAGTAGLVNDLSKQQLDKLQEIAKYLASIDSKAGSDVAGDDKW